MFIKEKKEKKKCLYDGFVKMNIMTIIIAQVFTLFFKTKLKKKPKKQQITTKTKKIYS